MYAQKHIPWFRHYDETRRSLFGPAVFKRLLGLDTIDKARGKHEALAVRFEDSPLAVVQTMTLVERVKDLRKLAQISYSNNSFSECLTHARMCAELIERHLSEMPSENASQSPEQVASEYFCLASECSSHLKQFDLAEDFANRSLLHAFSEAALSWRLYARVHSGNIEEAREDCNELLRINPSHKMAQEIETLLGPIPKIETTISSYENSIGMKFVSVPGTDVLFSIWDTRVKDFAAFVAATSYDAGKGWRNPGFSQTSNDPVVSVSWEDAKAFCMWLTEKERREEKVAASQEYRLPMDAEWSVAVGLPPERGTTPMEKEAKGKGEGVYPWGKKWPPPKGSGNYHRSLGVDTFDYTSPVGSFAANRFGLYDMGGNVRQWCEDWMNRSALLEKHAVLKDDGGGQKYHVVRGGSWFLGNPENLLSSYRYFLTPGSRAKILGFRCVLASSLAKTEIAKSNVTEKIEDGLLVAEEKGHESETCYSERSISKNSSDAIALRAYMIQARRLRMGWPGDTTGDWVEAERQLRAEER